MIGALALVISLVLLIQWYEQCKKGGADTNGMVGSLALLLAMVAVTAILVTALGVAVVRAAQHHMSIPAGEVPEARRVAARSLVRELAAITPLDQIRLDVRRQFSLVAYVENGSFEAIIYPDRRDFVRRVGGDWCEGLSITNLASVEIRGSRDGAVLARYSCFTKRAQMGRFMWQ